MKKKTKPVRIQALTFGEMIEKAQSQPVKVRTAEEDAELAKLLGELAVINKRIGDPPLMMVRLPGPARKKA